jgi:hypothetical protein
MKSPAGAGEFTRSLRSVSMRVGIDERNPSGERE